MHDFSCLKALHVLARQLVLESSKTNEEQFLRCSFGTSEKFLDIRSQAAILFKMWQIRDLSRISHTFSRMVNWQSLLNMNLNCQILFITVKINSEFKKDKKSSTNGLIMLSLTDLQESQETIFSLFFWYKWKFFAISFWNLEN